MKHAAILFVAFGSMLAGGEAQLHAQAVEVILAPDAALELAGLGSPVLDRLAVRERLTPPTQRRIAAEVPEIPDGVGLAAMGYGNHGTFIFTLDGWVELPGAGLVGPLDVVAKTGGTYEVRFAGSQAGVADGVAIDAIAYQNISGQIVLSFDTDFEVGGDYFRDTDRVIVHNNELEFASPLASELPPGLDVDGLGGGTGGNSLETVSFDGSGVLDGVAFDDEDIVEHVGSNNWEMLYDASLAGPAWANANLSAFIVLTSYLFTDNLESGGTNAWSVVVP